MKAGAAPSRLLMILGGALMLWAWSRTTKGSELIAKTVDLTLTRGLRNNNPGNIDRNFGTAWRGMSADQSSDSRFIVFDAPEWGIRAMARVLKVYVGRGLTSVRSIINTWAPPAENDTGAYVLAVARQLGVGPDDRISVMDFPALIAAIIQHENGVQPYPDDVIARGIALEETA